MPLPGLVFSSTYLKRLSEIEDFVFTSSGDSISAVESFLDEHDQVLAFLRQNPGTPAVHPLTGDQSWPFGDGRYRIFFKFNNKKVNLLDLIDNRMANLKIYPSNSLPTYSED